MKASLLFQKLDLFKEKMATPQPYGVFSEFEFQYNYSQSSKGHLIGSQEWLKIIFQSKYSRKLLLGLKSEAFNNLLFIAAKQQDFFSMIYRDLVDPGRVLSQRVDRFTFHVDEVWLDIRKTENKQIPRSHGIDLSLISLLLSITDPIKYLHYNREVFQKYLLAMESSKIQQFDDYERYCKVMKNTYLHMNNRIDMQTIRNLQLNTSEHYASDSIAWASIFARHVVGDLK